MSVPPPGAVAPRVPACFDKQEPTAYTFVNDTGVVAPRVPACLGKQVQRRCSFFDQTRKFSQPTHDGCDKHASLTCTFIDETRASPNPKHPCLSHESPVKYDLCQQSSVVDDQGGTRNHLRLERVSEDPSHRFCQTMTPGDNGEITFIELDKKCRFLLPTDNKWVPEMVAHMGPKLTRLGVVPETQAVFRGGNVPKALAGHYAIVRPVFQDAYMQVSGMDGFVQYGPAKALYDALGGKPVSSRSTQEWVFDIVREMKPLLECLPLRQRVPNSQMIFRDRPCAQDNKHMRKAFLDAQEKVIGRRSPVTYGRAKALYIRLGGKQISNKTTTKKRGNVSVAAVAPAD